MNVQKMAKSGSLGMKKAGEKDNLDILSRTLSGRRGTFFVLHFKIIQSYFRIKRYGLISTPSISAPIRSQMRFQSSIRVSERCFMKANWIHVNKSLHGQVTKHVGHAWIAVSVIYSGTFVFHMLPLWLKYLWNSFGDT